MRFVVSLTILVMLLLLIPDGDAWGRRRRSSKKRRRFMKRVKKVGKKVYKFYKKYKKPIHIGLRLLSRWKDAEAHINEIANLKAQDREAYNDYMQNLQDDLEVRFPEEDVSDMIASLDEVTDMQPDEIAAAVRSSQTDHSDNDHEDELIEHMFDEISE